MHSDDFWTQSEYEMAVGSALATCAQPEVKKTRAVGTNSLNVKRISIIRQEGIYIPGMDRVVPAPGPDGGWTFDRVNNPLPIEGCVGLNTNLNHLPDDPYEGYFRVVYFRERSSLGLGWQRCSPGQLYEMFFMAAQTEYLEGERFFFSVTDEGRIVACRSQKQVGCRESRIPGRTIEAIAATALQYVSDRRFAWTIEIKSHGMKLFLGCAEQHVQSLLRACTLPRGGNTWLAPIFHVIDVHRQTPMVVPPLEYYRYRRGPQIFKIDNSPLTVKIFQNISTIDETLCNERV